MKKMPNFIGFIGTMMRYEKLHPSAWKASALPLSYTRGAP